MRRDWIWGWVAALPSIIVAFLAIKSAGLYSESPYIAVGLALALATGISTGMLWIKNRHSLRKIIQSEGDVELVIRPIDAFSRAAILFVAILDTIILARLVIEWPVVAEWRLALALVTTISTGILWIKDRHSLLKVNQSGGAIERIIARIDGFWETAIFFTAILGTIILWSLVIEGRVVVEWGLGIIVIGLVSYLWSLQDTAYKKSG